MMKPRPQRFGGEGAESRLGGNANPELAGNTGRRDATQEEVQIARPEPVEAIPVAQIDRIRRFDDENWFAAMS